MGNTLATSALDVNSRKHFIRNLLDDIKALEIMLQKDMIESGIHRIGAEQEFCLVSKNWRPQKNANKLIKAIDDPHFTTELARFNLEANLDPFVLKGDCFSELQNQLEVLLSKAKTEAEKLDTYLLLTGILPTISKTELSFDYLTPLPRYLALNEMVKGFRGSDFQMRIKGVDELSITHDSILMESCNTSFQMHLQVNPAEFVDAFNWAQAISGPVLGICANSPLLLGRELWNETRIALFQQSIDTRMSSYAVQDQISRVSFGDDWERGTVADIFKNDIAQHKIILTKPIEENSLAQLTKGQIPKLQALNIHNGTVYRWNRPCYGTSNGVAHLRIENRYIPAGPTILDEMANLAFWVGLMMGRTKEEDIRNTMDFRDAKSNFIKAARTGKETVMRWRGRKVSVRDLVIRELLPLAYEGLSKMKVNEKTADRLLSVIDERAVGKTGAQWTIENFRRYKEKMRNDDALIALTKSMYEQQESGEPVHNWPTAEDRPQMHEFATNVDHIMSTRLFSVQEDDLAEMATEIMRWKNIHHLPVENQSGDFVGLLTWSHMEQFNSEQSFSEGLLVEDIMIRDPLLAYPDMPINEAINIMKQNGIGCLPVVHNEHLIGIVTLKDITQFEHDRSAQQSA